MLPFGINELSHFQAEDPLHAKERHERQRRQAQRDIAALYQALHDLGVPEDLVIEIEGRLRAQKKLLGKILASCFPPSLGVEVPMSSRGYADGTKMGPPVSWVPYPSVPGSNACASSAKISSAPFGATLRQ